ncbi:peptidylprolyl isomerase [Qipengyuania soli]|uniref:Peptidyl-prolyl cis-trans isomerase n=1 Tax=Qipengyuania soli TaxID=2782568 RepID=A0A7S8F677_9SPHN|nr:peptidylprolyl isomerase [Qipengyuania soli]QPC99896.1 peptidylprolyl isomerase [Qipengyuania soli]
MLKSSLALAAAALVAIAPVAAMAQEADAAAQATADAPATDQRVFQPISYDMAVDPDNILLLDLSNGQRVSIRLMPSWAPQHVDRVKTLARQGFYDGIIFHRVIEGFMAQTGDPTGTGTGGSQLPDLKQEFNKMPHVRGTVSMARAASEDSANSQFFIVFLPRFSLDNKYTNFGRVISNMAAVDAIQRGEPPANPTRIVQASIASDNKPVPAAPAPRIEANISADELNAPIGN